VYGSMIATFAERPKKLIERTYPAEELLIAALPSVIGSDGSKFRSPMARLKQDYVRADRRN
jgi:hypothetical protein